MPDWIAIVTGCAATVAVVEVIRRMRKASRERLAQDLERISVSLAEVADDLDGEPANTTRCAELIEQLDAIRSLLHGNSLVYGVKDDLIVGLTGTPDPPSRHSAEQVRARRLTLEVGQQLKSEPASVETDKLRRVSRMFKGAAVAMKAH